MGEAISCTINVAGIDKLASHRLTYFERWLEAVNEAGWDHWAEAVIEDGTACVGASFNYGFMASQEDLHDRLQRMARIWRLTYSIAEDAKYEFGGEYESYDPDNDIDDRPVRVGLNGEAPAVGLHEVLGLISRFEGDSDMVVATLVRWLGQ